MRILAIIAGVIVLALALISPRHKYRGLEPVLFDFEPGKEPRPHRNLTGTINTDSYGRPNPFIENR